MSTVSLFKRIAAAILLACLVLVTAHAQPEERPPAKLRFLFMDESAGDYFVAVGKNFQLISSTPYAISSPFTPASVEPLVIYKAAAIPDPITGEKERVEIARFTPPANTASALVMITPRPRPAGSTEPFSYGVEFIDSDPRTHPAGSIRILNRGRVAVAAQFGSENVTVQPGDTGIVSPIPDERNRVFTKVAEQSSSGWKLLSNRTSVLRPNQRLTGLFLYSPSGMIHFYSEAELRENGPPPPCHVWLTYTDTPEPESAR